MPDKETTIRRNRFSNLRSGAACIALPVGSYLLFLAILELTGGRPVDLDGVSCGPSPAVLTLASLPFVALFAYVIHRDGTAK